MMDGRYTVYARTLTFLLNGDEVLLIRHSPNAQIFPDLYNGVGGHIERGEDVLSAARREVREETGLDVPNLTLHCVLHVDEGSDRPGVMVFIFVGHTREHDVTDTREGTLHWTPLTRISELNLIPDLPPLLSRILARPPGAAPLFARSTIPSDPDDGSWEIKFVSDSS
jgi:8-oxo-dGTP diphosphatase